MKTYIIKNKNNGLFKIGRSSNVNNRLKTINSLSAGFCDLILIIDHDCESMLHANYSSQNIYGEWFILTDDDLIDLLDYSESNNRISTKVTFSGIELTVLNKNNFVKLSSLNTVNNSQYINSNSDFIKMLIPKYGNVLTQNGTGPIWCHVILFLEIARSISVEYKIQVYETLCGYQNKELHQIVSLAIDEAKKLK